MGALHALIVGVSAYPHLPGGTGSPAEADYGMTQLSASAASAAELERWLRAAGDRLAVPLGTVRMLVSPSPGELARDPGLEGRPGGGREDLRQAALAWREDCASDPENIALFYFAGHGLERSKRDMVMLCSDFGDLSGDPLYNAVGLHNLYFGMALADERPRMARTQLWFVDACRVHPRAFAQLVDPEASKPFESRPPRSERRCAPVYFGALPGEAAFAIPDERTFFNQALIESLDHAGGVKDEGGTEWKVTANSLLRGMQAAIEPINARLGTEQEIWDGGQMEDPDRRIARLDGVPEVDVSFELAPAAAAAMVDLAVSDLAGKSMLGPRLSPNPYSDRWPAGPYTMEVSPAIPGVEPFLPVRPPNYKWRANVP
jgi:hypothetical protein